MRGGDFEYKLYWKGEETGRGGVGLMVKHDLVESVMEVRRVFSKIISIDIVVNEKVVTVISVYASQSGRSEEDKEKFYEDLTAEVQSRHGISFVLGDFNGHIGRSSLGYDGIHGGFGWGERNSDGKRILEFADSLDKVVGNTFFKKVDKKLITYKSGNCATVIDYAVVQKEVMKKVKDIKVIPGKECFSQHRLLIRRVTRNSQWEGAVWEVWRPSLQPPEANGGLGAKPPAAGGWGFGGNAPSRRRHGVWGRSPQRSKILHFFAKISSF